MKHLLTLLAIMFLPLFIYGQVPNKMSYQAVVRDAENKLILNKEVGIRVSILQGLNQNNDVFSESHYALTNSNGLVTLQIGDGELNHGSFKNIKWSQGSYFIKIEIDPYGGRNYTIVGTSELLSVPYALHAISAERLVDNGKGNKPGDPDKVKEIDPIFTGSVASGITSIDIGVWNNDEVNDADFDSTNELQNWSNLPGIPSDILDGDDVDDADNDPFNEIETWATLSGIPSDIADGDDVNDNDNDPTNEIQDISGIIINEESIASMQLEQSVQDAAIAANASFAESDPVFTGSVASGITSNDISAWNIDEVKDADFDNTNELQNWSNLPGIPSDILDGDDVDDADNDPFNEIETWATLSGIPSDIADGDDVNDNDNDPTNEIQDISGIIINEESIAGMQLEQSVQDAAIAANASFAESDPVFTGSVASGITSNDISAWNIDEVNDADFDNTNELQNWSNLPDIPSDILDGDDVDDADNDPFNEIETWATLSGIPSDIADGDDVNDNDDDPTNEIQDISGIITNEESIARLQLDQSTQDAAIAANASFVESDPIFTGSVASGITLIDIDTWNNDEVNDADFDSTNELQNWLNLPGIPSDILDGDNVDDADNDPLNEVETWATLSGIPSDIADGDDVNDNDNDPTNEIETWITLEGIPLDLKSGALNDSRISRSNVIQHESAININNLSGSPVGNVVGVSDSQILQNKTIDASNNNLLNINDGSISVVAGINVTKLADGSVNNNELQLLNNLTSPAVGVTDVQTLTNKTISTTNNTFIMSAEDIASGTLANERIAESNITQHSGAIDHQQLSGVGSNTHSQIDDHVSGLVKHRLINDSGTSNIELWSSNKIDIEIADRAEKNHSHIPSDLTGLTTTTIAEGSNLYFTEARVNDNINVTLNTDHRTSSINPHIVNKDQVGLGDVENIKTNLNAGTLPNSSDDSSVGFSVGSRWIDIANQKEYVCLDSSVASAVWVQTNRDAVQIQAGLGISIAGQGTAADPFIISRDPDSSNGIDLPPGGLEGQVLSIIDGQLAWSTPIECSTVFYRDLDGDGYGNPNETVTGCSPPISYVNKSGDCADNNALVYPGAFEYIDGYDNDCDGRIDTPSLPKIGDLRDGGVIFWIDPSDPLHGLVVELGDSKLYHWSPLQTYVHLNGNTTFGYINVSQAMGEGIGAGITNTNEIITAHNIYDPDLIWEYAAFKARGDTASSSWFLPSKEELFELLKFRNTLSASLVQNGGSIITTSHSYWTSTKIDDNRAWAFDPISGLFVEKEKNELLLVRAIKAF